MVVDEVVDKVVDEVVDGVDGVDRVPYRLRLGPKGVYLGPEGVRLGLEVNFRVGS